MRLSAHASGRKVVARLGILFGAAIGLAACGESRVTSDLPALLLGPPGPEEEVEMVGRRPDAPGGPACPQIRVREETEVIREYAPGGAGDPAQLRYQGTISETARECTFTGDDHVRVKFGIAGRVVTGQAGGPGEYVLPIRVAFARRDGDAVWSELYRVPVTVEAGRGSASFEHVAEDIEFSLPAGESFGWYIVYAGFDEM